MTTGLFAAAAFSAEGSDRNPGVGGGESARIDPGHGPRIIDKDGRERA
jgi:hypothetical protein